MAMTTGASDALLFRPDMMDPSQPSGLWWCKDAEDMQTVGMNAVCKGILAEWKELEPWMEYINSFPLHPDRDTTGAGTGYSSRRAGGKGVHPDYHPYSR